MDTLEVSTSHATRRQGLQLQRQDGRLWTSLVFPRLTRLLEDKAEASPMAVQSTIAGLVLGLDYMATMGTCHHRLSEDGN